MSTYIKRIEIIHHQFEEIFYVDYSGLDMLEASKLADEFKRFVLDSGRRDVLVLANITNTKSSTELYNKFKSISTDLNPYIKRRCVVGLSPISKMLFTFYNNAIKKGAKAAGSIEEGLNYLVS